MITFTLDDITQDILIKLSGNAVADQRKFNVTFESELAKADYKAVCDGKELKTGDSVTGGSIVSLDITAKNNCVFKEAPAVMANGSNTELILDKTNNSYSVKDGIKITSDTKVAISGTAYEKYNVTLDGDRLTNARLEATYNDQSFDGGDVIEGDTVTLKITPNTGYAFKDLPVVKNGSANVDASAFKELSGGAYSVDVIIKSAVTLSVSGKAEAQQITDGSSPSDNANNASLSGTDFTKPEVLDNFLDAFANNKTVDNIQEIKEAINNKTAYIQAAINVTGASIEAKEEARSLIKENTSLGIDANNLSNENSAFLDIKLSSVCKRYSDNSTMSSIFVEELGDKIAVTMDLPSFEPVDNNKNRTYIVIRIHGSKAERLPDGDVGIIGERIKFFSNKFSTYIITFEDTDKESEPSGTPDDTTKPVIPPAYNPGGGSTISTPAPSTSPSTEPSKTPDATSSPAPGVTDTTKPSEKPAEPGSTDEPVATPDATKQPSTDNGGNGSSSSKIKVGKNVTISNTKYKVTSVSGTKAVQFTGAKKNAKKVVIPSTVKVSGKTFKVTSIANNALKGNKKITKLTIGANINKIGKNAFSGCSSLKSITIKSKKLTAKKTGKNAFKGINKKAVIKVPKAKIKTYKKIIKAKGAPKTVKIKK
ncbi:MAG: leucine-rich repeat protein [Lachnospiraceae bacterium]|nr:leucine-rich repeat protein [Lachnospiraceae bacterium]